MRDSSTSLRTGSGLTKVLSDGTTTYLYGNVRIAEYAGADWAYYLTDALGSVRQLASHSASILMAQTFEPYGDVLDSTGSALSNYGFTGEWTDGTGLQHLRARYMDTGIGKFISRDVWEGNYKRPLSLNKWIYVEGNPVNYTDPSGNAVCPCGRDKETGGCLKCPLSDIPIFGETVNYPATNVWDVLGQILAAFGAYCVTQIIQNTITQPNVWTKEELDSLPIMWEPQGTPEPPPKPTPKPQITFHPPPPPIPTATPDDDNRRVAVRHYSQAIEAIRSTMIIKRMDWTSPYIWVEYPIMTLNNAENIQRTTSRFNRPLDGEGGFVQFLVDEKLIAHDPHLPFVPNSSVINVGWLSLGFRLGDPGVNPLFFDWKGQFLR